MTVAYPTSLPPIPRTGANIKQVPAFDIFQTSAGVGTVKRTCVNPPLQYTTKIKLIGNEQIALFDNWFVKDTLNGALRFTISLHLPVNSGGAVHCVCQFSAPPIFSEIGTHSNRIKEVSLTFYIYNPTHASVNTQAGTYPNIPAPITKSVSESKTSLVIGGTEKYGKQSAVGAVQSADTYTLVVLMNYIEFQTFDAWWSNQQADGTKSFTAPLLTNQGLKNMQVRPLNGWSAKCNAGDVEVTLQVELTRPPLLNTWEQLGTELSISTQDLKELNATTDSVWRALKG